MSLEGGLGAMLSILTMGIFPRGLIIREMQEPSVKQEKVGSPPVLSSAWMNAGKSLLQGHRGRAEDTVMQDHPVGAAVMAERSYTWPGRLSCSHLPFPPSVIQMAWEPAERSLQWHSKGASEFIFLTSNSAFYFLVL